MIQSYISIGSNIDATMNIASAKRELSNIFTCTYSDNFYSEAEGFKGKDFINLVAGFETNLDPINLTQTLKSLEEKVAAVEKILHKQVVLTKIKLKKLFKF